METNITNTINVGVKSERTDADIISALRKKEVKFDRKARFARLFPELKRVMSEKQLSVHDIWKEVKDDLGGVTRVTFFKWWEQVDSLPPNA